MGAVSNVIALKGVQAFATNRRSPVHPRMPPPDTIAAVKGFRDVLPDESRRWRALEEAAERVFTCYGFGEIRLPVVERTELFARSLGETTDIVEKEMYSFADRDETGLTLRPEATAGVERNPLRMLDCKVESCQEIMARAPVAADSLCEGCRAHLAQVRTLLEQERVAYAMNPRLVRGLDYYCRTAFEVVAGGLGAQNAVGGGGRYDGLGTVRDLVQHQDRRQVLPLDAGGPELVRALQAMIGGGQ